MKRAFLSVLVLLSAGCATAGGREPLPADDLEVLAAEYTVLSDAFLEAQYDPVAFRLLLTDDAELHDGEDPKIGADQVVASSTNTWSLFPGMEGRFTQRFLGRSEVLNRQEVTGFLGWSETNPLIEWDLFGVRDGLISRWQFLYNPETVPFFISDPESKEASAAWLTRYTEAWSSGDPLAVAALYVEEAVRDDTLFEERVEGRSGIEAYAADWFDAYPGMTVELVEPIIERTRIFPMTGGVFTIGLSGSEPCEIGAAILLDVNDQGIIRERIYYGLESLIECGWAE